MGCWYQPARKACLAIDKQSKVVRERGLVLVWTYVVFVGMRLLSFQQRRSAMTTHGGGFKAPDYQGLSIKGEKYLVDGKPVSFPEFWQTMDERCRAFPLWAYTHLKEIKALPRSVVWMFPN